MSGRLIWGGFAALVMAHALAETAARILADDRITVAEAAAALVALLLAANLVGASIAPPEDGPPG